MPSVETFQTMNEAAGAVNERSKYLAGGTLVMRAVNYGDQSFDKIVRSRQIERSIQPQADGIRIGAGATMADILASRDLAFLHPVAASIGGPAIRNMATVGGNLFAHYPYGDFATALLALDAQIVMTSGQSEAIETFLSSRTRSRGLVSAVVLPRVSDGAFRYSKVSRVKPKGISVMCIAAHLPGIGGRLGDVRIAWGAMGETPLRAKECERALSGATLDESGIAAALKVATNGLNPKDDPIASAWYRREVASVHLKRLLLDGGRR